MLGHWPVIDWLRRATKDARKENSSADPRRCRLRLPAICCGRSGAGRANAALTIRLIGLDALNRETIRALREAVTDDADEISYCVPGLVAASARAAPGAEDGSDWPGTLKGRHRQVVDAYAPNDGFPLAFA